MGTLLSYSGIVTKVRAMEAKLLRPENFEEIANLHSVPEVVSYLKETKEIKLCIQEVKEFETYDYVFIK